MSDQANGLRDVIKIALVALVALTFGPWLFMVIGAWLLEPRTGSWGAWPHIVGVSWAVLLWAFVLHAWMRK